MGRFVVITDSPMSPPMGSILAGVCTATEAAVLAVVYAFFLSIIVYRTLPLKEVPNVLLNGAKSAAMVLAVVAAANMLSWAVTMDIKQGFFREISEIAPKEALLCTNTSGLHITEIAEACKYPERFMGQHWLNPPHLLPLCEIIAGAKTSSENVQKMRELVKGLGKQPVVVGDINGFIINRIQFAVLREALHIVAMVWRFHRKNMTTGGDSMRLNWVAEKLCALGYKVRTFPDKESAAAYLNQKIDGKTVGFGGSMTLEAMVTIRPPAMSSARRTIS